MTAPTDSPDTAPDTGGMDVGVTLGDYNGRPVVVAGFHTAGITTQLQLPPAEAAQAGIAILAAAQAAGVDLTALLGQVLGGGSRLEVPNTAQVRHIIGNGAGHG